MRFFVYDGAMAAHELTGYEDRDAPLGTVPASTDLGSPVVTFRLELADAPAGAIPLLNEPELAHGMPFRVTEDDGVTVTFRGRIEEVTLSLATGEMRWSITAVDKGRRPLDLPTKALDRSAVTQFDRQHVIDAFTSAMQNIATANGTIDDPVYTANAPDWVGIRAIATFRGRDWQYRTLADVLRQIAELAGGGVQLRIRADNVVEYGPVGAEDAPFVVGDVPIANGTTVREIIDGSYREAWVMGAHRNKFRIGGAGAAEHTAYDESSYARLHEINEERYRNDESIAADEVKRIAYAELARARRRRTFAMRITDAGVQAGQMLPIAVAGAPVTWRAPWPETLFPVMARSDSGVLSHMRGHALVQRVEPDPIGPAAFQYAITAGEYHRDFAEVVAESEAAVAL